MKSRIVRIILPALLTVASEHAFLSNQSFAITYLSIEQAQQVLAPQVVWEELKVTLNDEQIDKIEELSGITVLSPEMKVWKSPQGDFFIVDNVLGKHEFITYAVLLSSDGKLKGIEILDYRESYGEEIRRAEWRAQFVGKSQVDELEFGNDILNISGATISCSQITKGVTRLISTYQVVLRNLNRL